MHNNRFTTAQYILWTVLAIIIAFWFLLYQSGLTDSFWNYLFSFIFSLVPLCAGLYGCYMARGWGGLTSAVGRGVFFISLGSVLWGTGSMIWSYYNFFVDVAMPYPSLADVGFVLSVPCWIYGILSLSKATGARAALRDPLGKIFTVIVFLGVVALSYYLLVVVARHGTVITDSHNILKLCLDLVYPISDVIILMTALTLFGLSANYLGGKYKYSIWLLLAGFAVMYIADFVFSYTTTVGTFYDGNVGDLLFAIALSLISIGAVGFQPQSVIIRNDNV